MVLTVCQLLNALYGLTHLIPVTLWSKYYSYHSYFANEKTWHRVREVGVLEYEPRQSALVHALHQYLYLPCTAHSIFKGIHCYLTVALPPLLSGVYFVLFLRSTFSLIWRVTPCVQIAKLISGCSKFCFPVVNVRNLILSQWGEMKWNFTMCPVFCRS